MCPQNTYKPITVQIVKRMIKQKQKGNRSTSNAIEWCGKSKLNWLFEFRPIFNALHILSFKILFISRDLDSGGLSSHKINEKSSWNLKLHERIWERWISYVWISKLMPLRFHESWNFETFLWDISSHATSFSIHSSEFKFSIFNNMSFCHYQHLLKW